MNDVPYSERPGQSLLFFFLFLGPLYDDNAPLSERGCGGDLGQNVISRPIITDLHFEVMCADRRTSLSADSQPGFPATAAAKCTVYSLHSQRSRSGTISTDTNNLSPTPPRSEDRWPEHRKLLASRPLKRHPSPLRVRSANPVRPGSACCSIGLTQPRQSPSCCRFPCRF